MSDPTRTHAPDATKSLDHETRTHDVGSRHDGSLASGFDLLEEIGRGGMGIVWRARDRALHRDVAVKVLLEKYAPDSSIAARFIEEAQITSQLQHPGIPAVYHVGQQTDGRPFLAMKLIKGRTLDEMLKANEPIATLAVFEAIAQAVGFAHAHGVIHRDLKPHNIMVGAFGEVQVMDWGLAKVLASRGRQPQESDAEATEIRTAGDGSHTRSGSILGTPAYMPPEQAAGLTEQVTERSDVFGLGAILCAMLTGAAPFTGRDAESVRRNAVRGLMDEARAKLATCQAEPEVVALCLKCLSFEPGERPATAGELAEQVAALRTAAEERARQAELAEARAAVEAESQRKRRRLLQLVVAVLTAGGVVAIVLLIGIIGTTRGLIEARAKERIAFQDAEAARLAEMHQTKLALRAAELEKEATHQANLRLAEFNKVSETMLSIFDDLDIREVKKDNRPLEAVLADRLKKAAKDVNAGAVGDPLIVAKLQDRLGSTLVSLGYYPDAIPLFTAARTTFIEKLGPDHTDTLMTASHLGMAYADAGKFAQALPLLEPVVPIWKERHGPAHRLTLNAMNNLALAYTVAGKLDRAVPLYEETLKLQQDTRGPHHYETLRTMRNLAWALLSIGQQARALKLFDETAALMKEHIGIDHPDTLATMRHLAAAHQERRAFDKALPIFNETLRLQKARLGADHPETLLTVNSLGTLYHDLGQLNLALPLLEESLAYHRKRNGPAHPNTLTLQNNVAMLYFSLGQHERARDLHSQTLEGRRAALGDGHPATLVSMGNLGTTHYNMGRIDLALPLFEESVRGFETLKLHNQATDQGVVSLIRCLEDLNHLARAEELRRKRLPKVRAAGAESSLYAGELALLASNLLRQKKWAEAEPVCRESLAIRRKMSPEFWTTFSMTSMLGESLAGQKKHADAEPLLLAGYEGMKQREKTIPPGSNRLREAGQRLVDFYTATGQAAKAEEWRAKLPTEIAPPPRKK